MLNRTMLAKSLLIAFSGSAALSGQSVFAQSPQPQELQRVEVTGSNIRRTDSETASPVQRLTREDIEKSGKSSVAELLQTLAVDNQGSVPTTFGAGFASGASGISLRGLGAASTLVLVNGRRIAPYGLADDGQKVFADLNMIPLEAVERVEILKDGASSIYGSDAIAGVVNVILRSDFKGVVGKINYGQSRYGDGKEARAAITTGFGDISTDKYNFLFNLEAAKKDAIYYRDRSGRGAVGRVDLRDLGFSAQEALGGTGAITTNNAAGSAVNGNVRQPGSNNYYNRGSVDPLAGFTRPQPGAACKNFTNHPQGDPGYNRNVDANGDPQLPFIQSGVGCLTDASQDYGQVQPEQKSINFFTRGTFQLTPELTGYAELNLYNNKSSSSGTPSGVTGSVGFPGGPVSNSSAALGGTHPDNPYTSTSRLRYLATDVGPRTSDVDSTFTRFVAGVKGSFKDWDFDTAVLYSQSKVSNQRAGYLQRDVEFALLNPNGFAVQPGATSPSTLNNAAVAAANSAAYAALPAGTLWRIAESAGLNSAAMYAALSPKISNDALSKTAQIDFKASRELMQLSGGALGLALGGEFRRESINLDPTSGTERGNIIGLGYSAYNGSRNVTAAYAELLAPVLKSLELSAAVRVDHYSDVGNSYTPKVGAKWTPLPEVAVRATYAEGFRAPSSAENGVGGLAAFSTAKDPLRCNPPNNVAAACDPASIAIITSPNANLVPEKSKSYTLGFVWDPLPKSSISVDLWQIVRNSEINQELTDAAIAAGKVSRDASTSTKPGDPGAITAVLANYVNSAKTTVRGVDVDARQGFDLGSWGKLTGDVKWTHLFTFNREEQDGSSRDFAGTHGNCDVTNCIGTPADRVNFGLSWDRGPVKIAASVNYRASLDNKNFKNDPDGCASHYANGDDAPNGCRIASFTTVDLTARWQVTSNVEVSGGIQNLFDRVPPLDPLTYGQQGFNPLDSSGAIGRFFNVGLKYKF